MDRSRAGLVVVAVAAVASLAGCGSSSTSTQKTASTPHRHARSRPRLPGPLHLSGSLQLPAARSGIAASVFGGRIVTSGGLSSAGVSTDGIFELDSGGRALTAGSLPGPVHDAASAVLAGRLLLFGGGRSEGSDRIVQVRPGTPRLIGVLPQPLSDLDAVSIGSLAYVVGGWNGTDTNSAIYAVTPGGSVTKPASIPLGVRYPAAGALHGRLIIAGGETASGIPTARAWSFDPGSRRVSALPDLPAPTDHTAGVALGGTFYVLGGLRRGSLTDAIVSWRPGQRRWRDAGHLPGQTADAAAVAFDGSVALVGGRDSAGPRSAVTLLRAR